MIFQERSHHDTYILPYQQGISSSAPELAAAWVFSQLFLTEQLSFPFIFSKVLIPGKVGNPSPD